MKNWNVKNLTTIARAGVVNIANHFKISNFFSIVNYNFPSDLSKSSSSSVTRDQILSRVRLYWIDGLLEQNPFYKEIKFTLRLRWWSYLHWKNNLTGELLPVKETVTSKFKTIANAYGGTLLIGGLGSGKTIALLEIAKDLLKSAEENSEFPIPLVLNLMSWGNKHLKNKNLKIEDWIIDEAVDFYKLGPRDETAKFFREQSFILLLDGLDEVSFEHRKSCWEEIINFKKSVGHKTAVLVACRINDENDNQEKKYFDHKFFKENGFLDEKIFIEPLSQKEIDKYFDKQGESLAGVLNACREDEVMRSLTEAPLFLWIMTVAYKDYTARQLRKLSRNQRLDDLFTTYIDRLTDPPTNAERYTTLDDLREKKELHELFQEALNRQDEVSKEKDEQVKQRGYGKWKTINWLAFLSRQIKREGTSEFRLERLSPSWLERKSDQLLVKLSQSTIFAFIPSFSVLLDPLGPLNAIHFRLALFLAIQVFLTSIFFYITEHRVKIIPPEKLTWNFARFKSSSSRMLIVYSSLFLLLLLLDFCFGFNLLNRLKDFSPAMLSILPVVGYIPSRASKAEAISPNFGITTARNNALSITLFCGITSLVGSTLLGNLDLRNFLIHIFPLSIGMGMLCGGAFCIQHILIRLVLSKRGYAPENYIDFLQYARERLLIYRTGGSYIFIHILLMEHFARSRFDQ